MVIELGELKITQTSATSRKTAFLTLVSVNYCQLVSK
jgi:hypothetical protein